jgi:hypothetical protein
MRVVLISTYDLGRQPFGLASPAAWLRRAGFDVALADTARRPLPAAVLAGAGLIALYLPMHTAARLAVRMLPALRAAAPGAHLCAYGLYAALHRPHLEAGGVATVLGAEFEADLLALAESLRAGSPAPPAASHLPKVDFLPPDRAGLPPLDDYVRLVLPGGEERIAGSTETTRGCLHRCRHCPITPVYGGALRVIPSNVVLADIRQQAAAGARHISFADPDFFNGPAHALRVAEAMHAEFPALTFDATIKIEHLLRHRRLLPRLRAAGCLFVTTAVESFDDAILRRLDKGHTAADVELAFALAAEAGLALSPTFLAFTPWTTVAGYAALLAHLRRLDLVDRVAPVQLGMRLLIPPGSPLLDLPDAAGWLGDFVPAELGYRWRALDPEADALCARVQALIARASKAARPRSETFAHLEALVAPAPGPFHAPPAAPPRAAIPYLNEPWFC